MSTLSLADWLSMLKGHLACLRPEGLGLVHGGATAKDPQWCECLDSSTEFLASTPAMSTNHRGWLIGLPGVPIQLHQLFVATNLQLDPGDPRLVEGVALCRFALGQRLEQDQRMLLSRQPIHTLRNGLNSVAMTAAVLLQSELPEALQPFAQDLQESVSSCLQALLQLSAVIESRVNPCWPEPHEPKPTGLSIPSGASTNAL